MPTLTKSLMLGALLALGLAGCRTTVVAPNSGPAFYGPGQQPYPGYSRPNRGGAAAVLAYGENGFRDGLDGRPWPCEDDARVCGARSPDPRAALAYYQDGWSQGWRTRCDRTRGRDERAACERTFQNRGFEEQPQRRRDFFHWR